MTMQSQSDKQFVAPSLRILLAAGGTGGPVAPLLAVAEEIKQSQPQAEFLLLGTTSGLEKAMALHQKVGFAAIPAGKWRRYASVKNLAAPFQVLAGFFKALQLIRQFKPTCALGSGSFVQVPALWAAFFLKIPILIHQQDVKPSLANILCAPAASVISLTFSKTHASFRRHSGLFKPSGKDKVIVTGNPVRRQIQALDRTKALISFGFKPEWPSLLVIGGGSGARAINLLVSKALPELTRAFQVLHITGKGKSLVEDTANYRQFDFAQNMGVLYSAADFVLARAGLSTITELSALGKVSIMVPIPKSHQEANALLLFQKKAAVVLDQDHLDAQLLLKVLKKLMFDVALQRLLAKNIREIMPSGAREKIASLVLKLSNRSNAN